MTLKSTRVDLILLDPKSEPYQVELLLDMTRRRSRSIFLVNLLEMVLCRD
jgi:hypothetical protein